MNFITGIICGAFIGGFLGVSVMAILQVGRINSDTDDRMEDEE